MILRNFIGYIILVKNLYCNCWNLKRNYKTFEKSDLSCINKKPIFKDLNLNNIKNKPSLKIRNGRELIKFDNLEFSRIFMAWLIPNPNDQKIIGLEILVSILCVGRNSRLVKTLKEDSNLVESVYVDVNASELGDYL